MQGLGEEAPPAVRGGGGGGGEGGGGLRGRGGNMCQKLAAVSYGQKKQEKIGIFFLSPPSLL